MNPPVYDDLVYNGPAFATSSVVVHKTSFEKIKNFNISKKFIAWEDWDAWLRFAKQTDDFFHIQEKLSYITIDNENFSTEKIKIKNLNSFKNKYLKKNMHIPNWYIYTLVVCYFNCNFYFDVNSLFVKINFIKLNFLQKIKFISQDEINRYRSVEHDLYDRHYTKDCININTEKKYVFIVYFLYIKLFKLL